MAEELLDTLGRLRVTREIDAWLETVHRRTGKSKQEIARTALHREAVDFLDTARVARRFDPREGSGGTDGGST